MGAARSVLDLDECVPMRRSRPAWNRTKYTYEPQLDATRLTSANNGVEQLSFNYEALPPFQSVGFGAQATDTRNTLGLIQGQYKVTRDITSEIASIQDQAGHTLLKGTYDPAARLLSMASGNLFGSVNPLLGFLGQQNVGALSTQITYDAFGRKSKIAHSTGLTGILSYDELNRPTEIAWEQSGMSFFDKATPFASEGLTYDPAGNITEANHLFGRVQYGYDPTNQLTSVSLQGNFTLFPGIAGPSFKTRFTRDFTYDPSGNRVGDSLMGSAQYVADQIVSNSQSSFASDSNAYGNLQSQTDANGWMTSQFGYRPDGKLSSFQRGITAGRQPAWDGSDHNVANVTYYFDALGRRVAKSFQMAQSFLGTRAYTQTFSYLVDQDKILLGRAGNQGLTLYLDGQGIDEHLGEVSQFSASGFATDHLGSVLNSDVAGALHSYGPFGETLPSWTPVLAWDADPVMYGYAGRQYDRESGQYYYRARMYNPTTGRFTSKDPLGVKSGDANLYRYVRNNPLMFFDPLGLCPNANIANAVLISDLATIALVAATAVAVVLVAPEVIATVGAIAATDAGFNIIAVGSLNALISAGISAANGGSLSQDATSAVVGFVGGALAAVTGIPSSATEGFSALVASAAAIVLDTASEVVNAASILGNDTGYQAVGANTAGVTQQQINNATDGN